MFLEGPLDVAAYLDRIGLKPAAMGAPDLATLSALHLAHASHIPFENIDVLLGRQIRLDVPSLEAKLVRDRRGGYCFEQNTLFAAALEAMGFAVTGLAARVRVGSAQILPRTHMLLRVDLEVEPWIADVGFGRFGLLQPIPLLADVETTQWSWQFRLRKNAQSWVLQARQSEGWEDQYEFTLEPQQPVDYDPPNHFCATHPQSRFLRVLTVQLPTPEARKMVRNRDFTIRSAAGETTRPIGEDELLPLLEREFGLFFPPGTKLPVPSAAQ